MSFDFNLPSEISAVVSKVVAILSGAAVSVVMASKEEWGRRLVMAAVACPVAWYSGPELVKFLPNLSPGFISFILGVFGARIVGRLYDFVLTGPWTDTLVEWLRSVLRLPPSPPRG